MHFSAVGLEIGASLKTSVLRRKKTETPENRKISIAMINLFIYITKLTN